MPWRFAYFVAKWEILPDSYQCSVLFFGNSGFLQHWPMLPQYGCPNVESCVKQTSNQWEVAGNCHTPTFNLHYMTSKMWHQHMICLSPNSCKIWKSFIIILDRQMWNYQNQKRDYFNLSLHCLKTSWDFVKANFSYHTKCGKILFFSQIKLKNSRTAHGEIFKIKKAFWS